MSLLSGSLVLMAMTNPILPSTPFDYMNLNLPAHFLIAVSPFPAVIDFENTPVDNQISNDGATLGRVLFYDKNLSQNNTISCGSCHQQAFAFTDTAVHSMGFNGRTTRRHSMTIVNTRWAIDGRMFWDERAATLEAQTLMPFQDTVEMGLTLPLLVQRVRQEVYYPQLFANAFGDTAITTDRISKALAQFIRSIVSHSSKYDIGRAQVNSPTDAFPNFSPSENQGKALFLSPAGHCSNCHKSEAFVMSFFGPVSNGLDLVSTTDLGLYETTHNSSDIGKFKIPTLRNIELTAPYMHDGRFPNLEAVIDHYSTGIQLHMNLPPGLIDTTGPQPTALQLNFSNAERINLVAFLKTLTDTSLISEVKWSDPFNFSTSISNNETFSPPINIYPIPATYSISIAENKALINRILEISILNLQGQQLYSTKEYYGRMPEIDISGFSAGVYFLRIRSGNKELIKRFVKSDF